MDHWYIHTSVGPTGQDVDLQPQPKNHSGAGSGTSLPGAVLWSRRWGLNNYFNRLWAVLTCDNPFLARGWQAIYVWDRIGWSPQRKTERLVSTLYTWLHVSACLILYRAHLQGDDAVCLPVKCSVVHAHIHSHITHHALNTAQHSTAHITSSATAVMQ